MVAGPVAVMVLVISSMTDSHHLLVPVHQVLTLPSVQPELFATVVKALSYSYPSIAAATLLIFSCSWIDTSPGAPGEVVAAEGLFWTRVGRARLCLRA